MCNKSLCAIDAGSGMCAVYAVEREVAYILLIDLMVGEKYMGEPGMLDGCFMLARACVCFVLTYILVSTNLQC